METFKKTRFILLLMFINMSLFSQTYTMPAEHELHEGTWLQWPHQFEYGTAYRNSLDATWIAMTQALVAGEKVHIIAYNSTEQTRITNLLIAASVSLVNVDFKIMQTNDVWIRDNGPIFVRDISGNLRIEDWGFNGWGTKYNFNKCNPIPTSVGTAIGMPVINLNSVMTNEGGAVELDGKGVLLATRSSIISQSPANSIRNLGMTQTQAEAIFTTNLGVSKFIWLNGGFSSLDVTDMHIDGFAKFANDSTLVTMNNTDLLSWGVSAPDIATLYAASNVSNKPYNFVYLPLTQNNVVTTASVNLGYQGSYPNYYIANTVILVPNYNDPNDAVANSIIQGLHPGRTVVGIDCRNLYEWGGMVHCVTQQQPSASVVGIGNNSKNKSNTITIYPNPMTTQATIKTSVVLKNATLSICNIHGQTIRSLNGINGQTIILQKENLPSGVYFIKITQENKIISTEKLILAD